MLNIGDPLVINIYDNGFEMMLQSDVITFFTLYRKKSARTKITVRGPLKCCGNENAKKKIAEIGNQADSNAETQ